MAIRFTIKDVARVARRLKGNKAIVSISTFLRAYDLYAEDSYIKRSKGYTPTLEDASSLDGSDPNSFCTNVCIEILGEKLMSKIEEKREQLAPMTEVMGLVDDEGKPIARPYGKADRVAGKEKRATSYRYVGRQKGRIVYSRKIEIKTRYGKQFRYIDNKGMYVGVKKNV